MTKLSWLDLRLTVLAGQILRASQFVASLLVKLSMAMLNIPIPIHYPGEIFLGSVFFTFFPCCALSGCHELSWYGWLPLGGLYLLSGWGCCQGLCEWIICAASVLCSEQWSVGHVVMTTGCWKSGGYTLLWYWMVVLSIIKKSEACDRAGFSVE